MTDTNKKLPFSRYLLALVVLLAFFLVWKYCCSVPIPCTPPTGLQASKASPTAITFTWDTVPASSGYVFKLFDQTPPSPDTLVLDTVVSLPPLTVSGLTPGHTYRGELSRICPPGEDTSASTNVVFMLDIIIVDVVECNGNQCCERACSNLSCTPVAVGWPAGAICEGWAVPAGSETYDIEIRNPAVPSVPTHFRFTKSIGAGSITITHYTPPNCTCATIIAPPSTCATDPDALCGALTPATAQPNYMIRFSGAGFCLTDGAGTPLGAPYQVIVLRCP